MNETLEKNTTDIEKNTDELNEKSEYTLTFENNSSWFVPEKEESKSNDEPDLEKYNSIFSEASEECTSLITVKERRILAAQTMFKKSIRISLKSFLISLSLSFLNLFI